MKVRADAMRQLQCILSHFCFESVFYSPGSSLVSFPNPPALVPSEAENLSRSSILFNCDRSSLFCNFKKSIDNSKDSNPTFHDNDEAADGETRL